MNAHFQKSLIALSLAASGLAVQAQQPSAAIPPTATAATPAPASRRRER